MQFSKLQDSHIEILTALYCASIRLYKFLPEFTDEYAQHKSFNLICRIANGLKSKDQICDADRAKDLIEDWYNVNEAYFEDPVEHVQTDADKEIIRKKQFRRLGYITNDTDGTHIWANPAELRDYLKKQGFDPDAILRSLIESNDICGDLGRRGFTIRHTINGKRISVFGLKYIVKNQEEPPF